jgi:hypothetical protein
LRRKEPVIFKSWSTSFILRGVLAARTGIGTVTLALLFGLYNLIYGVSLIVTGVQGRSSDRSLHSVMAGAA